MLTPSLTVVLHASVAGMVIRVVGEPGFVPVGEFDERDDGVIDEVLGKLPEAIDAQLGTGIGVSLIVFSIAAITRSSVPVRVSSRVPETLSATSVATGMIVSLMDFSMAKIIRSSTLAWVSFRESETLLAIVFEIVAANEVSRLWTSCFIVRIGSAPWLVFGSGVVTLSASQALMQRIKAVIVCSSMLIVILPLRRVYTLGSSRGKL